MTRSNQDQTDNAAAPTPRPLGPQWSVEAIPLSAWCTKDSPFTGNCATVKRGSADVPPVGPRPQIFTFNRADIQKQVHNPSFHTVHKLSAAEEETCGASSAFTEPAHPQQEAPVTAASGAALKIEIPPLLSQYPKVSQHPAQHVSAAIGERSVQITDTMGKFFSYKFPSPEPENDDDFTP